MYLRDSHNEYGTPVSKFTCDSCGNVYTVCPAVPTEKLEEWQNCLSEDCSSYEPTRDADLYLSLGMYERDPA